MVGWLEDDSFPFQISGLEDDTYSPDGWLVQMIHFLLKFEYAIISLRIMGSQNWWFGDPKRTLSGSTFVHFRWMYIGVNPKIGDGKPPKWMVKIMVPTL